MPKTSLAHMRQVAEHGTAEKKRLEKTGKKAIADFLKLKQVSQHAFYAMGETLAILKQEAVIHALGYASFSALCNVALHMSHDQADQLVAISANFEPEIAAQLSPTKASAIINLARAFGKKTTPAGIVARGTIPLPFGNKTLDVRGSSASAIRAAAREIRRLGPASAKPATGVRLSKKEAAFVQHLSRRLKDHGVQVEGVAKGKAAGAHFRLAGPIENAKLIAEAILATVRESRG